MNERKLIEKVKGVYDPGMSDKGRQFILQHEQRKLRLKDVAEIELRYIGFAGIPAAVILLVMMSAAALSRDACFMWALCSVLPIIGLIPVSMVGRSERYGMNEMEAASRFSLYFVRMTRMMILGCFSLAVLLISSVVMGNLFKMGVFATLVYIACPYLLNAWGCMLVLRKWRAAENIFGCITIALATAILPMIAERTELIHMISAGFAGAACAVLLAFTVKESISYIKESEYLSWNLC